MGTFSNRSLTPFPVLAIPRLHEYLGEFGEEKEAREIAARIQALRATPGML